MRYYAFRKYWNESDFSTWGVASIFGLLSKINVYGINWNEFWWIWPEALHWVLSHAIIRYEAMMMATYNLLTCVAWLRSLNATRFLEISPTEFQISELVYDIHSYQKNLVAWKIILFPTRRFKIIYFVYDLMDKVLLGSWIL